MSNNWDQDQRVFIQQLLEAGQLGVAQWMSAQWKLDLQHEPWLPENDSSVRALFQRYLLRAKSGLPERANLRAQNIHTESVSLFLALLNIQLSNDDFPSATEIRKALFDYYGASIQAGDQLEESENAW